MKFSKRFVIRKKEDIPIFAKGIWSPTAKDWVEIIEDYIHISRTRIKNKWAMLKLQLTILEDIINFVTFNDQIKGELKKLQEREHEVNPSDKIEEKEIEFMKSDMFFHDLMIVALKEIIDGIVWRYFKYNRALLYTLADKEVSGVVRPDKGLINTMYELARIFTNPGEVAILNDITNFLKVGDLTTIKTDGAIEFVEVKSGNRSGRGRRITRQKERMAEIVEFFNTGIGEYDGKKIRIVLSPVKQKNYLPLLLNIIRSAKARGSYSEVIGNYMIVECMYPERLSDSKIAIEYFENRHRSIKDQWIKMKDVVIPFFATDKLEFSRNFAPYTIFPFPDEICADILCGRVLTRIITNYSEIMRIFHKNGWETVDSIFFKDPDELDKIDITKTPMMIVGKGEAKIQIGPGMIGRLPFEFLSPKALIDEFERIYAEGSPEEAMLQLTSFSDDETAWY
jgi:hypothetical protein